jgi:hypothetical protein
MAENSPIHFDLELAADTIGAPVEFIDEEDVEGLLIKPKNDELVVSKDERWVGVRTHDFVAIYSTKDLVVSYNSYAGVVFTGQESDGYQRISVSKNGINALSWEVDVIDPIIDNSLPQFSPDTVVFDVADLKNTLKAEESAIEDPEFGSGVVLTTPTDRKLGIFDRAVFVKGPGIEAASSLDAINKIEYIPSRRKVRFSGVNSAETSYRSFSISGKRIEVHYFNNPHTYGFSNRRA